MAQRSPRVVATIIWATLLAGATAFFGVALFLVVGLRGGAGIGAPLGESTMIGGSLVISLVAVALSWLWAVRMRVARPAAGGETPRRAASSIPPGPEADAVARLGMACGLCEGSALAAVIAFMQTGKTLAIASYAISWLALAAHFPGDRHWTRLMGVPAGAARKPMIRG